MRSGRDQSVAVDGGAAGCDVERCQRFGSSYAPLNGECASSGVDGHRGCGEVGFAYVTEHSVLVGLRAAESGVDVQVVPLAGRTKKLAYRLDTGSGGAQAAIGFAGPEVRVIASGSHASTSVRFGEKNFPG